MNLEKEFEKLFGSLPSLFDVGSEWIPEGGGLLLPWHERRTYQQRETEREKRGVETDTAGSGEGSVL